MHNSLQFQHFQLNIVSHSTTPPFYKFTNLVVLPFSLFQKLLNSQFSFSVQFLVFLCFNFVAGSVYNSFFLLEFFVAILVFISVVDWYPVARQRSIAEKRKTIFLLQLHFQMHSENLLSAELSLDMLGVNSLRHRVL